MRAVLSMKRLAVLSSRHMKSNEEKTRLSRNQQDLRPSVLEGQLWDPSF